MISERYSSGSSSCSLQEAMRERMCRPRRRGRRSRRTSKPRGRQPRGSQLALGAVVLQAKPAIVEGSAECLLVANGVAESGSDEASPFEPAVLAASPGEEDVDEGANGFVAPFLALRGGALGVLAVSGEDRIDAAHAREARASACRRRPPKTSSAHARNSRLRWEEARTRQARRRRPRAERL